MESFGGELRPLTLLTLLTLAPMAPLFFVLLLAKMSADEMLLLLQFPAVVATDEVELLLVLRVWTMLLAADFSADKAATTELAVEELAFRLVVSVVTFVCGSPGSCPSTITH